MEHWDGKYPSKAKRTDALHRIVSRELYPRASGWRRRWNTLVSAGGLVVALAGTALAGLPSLGTATASRPSAPLTAPAPRAAPSTATTSWLRRAVAAGSPRAEVLLGVFYAQRIGAGVDPAKAALLWWTAARAAYPAGLFNLGDLYLHGRGVPRDVLRGDAYQKAALLMGLRPRSALRHAFDRFARRIRPGVRRAADLTAKHIAIHPQKIDKP